VIAAVVKYHNMKTYGGMEHSSCIHNLAVRWCDSAQVKPAPLSVGKELFGTHDAGLEAVKKKNL
jgi:hypothetical protein